MSPKGMVFDLDGTLGDTLPVCFAAFRQTFRVYLGREYSDREIRSLFGPSEEGILKSLVGDRWEQALRHYLDAYQEAHQKCGAPFPGIEETLKLLQDRGVKLAIVTGKGPKSARISLDVLGLADYFELVEAGSMGGGVKPQAMRRVIAAWALNPSDVACLGDSVSDIRSAREVGAIPLGAAWAATSDYDLLASLEPDEVFRSVPELTIWLARALGAPGAPGHCGTEHSGTGPEPEAGSIQQE